MTVFVAENLEDSRRYRLFTFLDTDYFATPYAWVNFPLMAVIGIVIAFMVAPSDQLLTVILVGIGYGLLIVASSFCHGVGHIISSRMVNAPMEYILVTATVSITHYEDAEEQPSRVHIVRSLGGPVFNLLLGFVAIAIFVFAVSNHFLLFIGGVNLLFGIMTLLPIPTLDGAVIWRELRT